MSSRQGGKLKPLKAPKKDKKEETDDEIAFKEKKKAEAEALKAAREKALKGGPMGGTGGIKKSGKK
ncbi:translation machinery associated TMA7 [Cyathus striatus]|nr:translation machinery associated TMA7 [Cyathus striatus]KAF9001963.1 translation machinery associated TMA7 [Cyathus striatus]